MKKTIIIITAVVLFVALTIASAFGVTAARHKKTVNADKEEVLKAIDDYRNNVKTSFHLYISYESYEDPEFADFLVEQISKMCDNSEYGMISEFVDTFEDDEYKNSTILDLITNKFNSAQNLVEALDMKDALSDSDYYGANLVLNKNSKIIVSYLEVNGTKEITTNPDEGFYASEKNDSSYRTIGITGSSLYNSSNVIYKGDFKSVYVSGRRLNTITYTEENYERTDHYFRENEIEYPSDYGEYIYSGDFLFCFSTSGDLVYYTLIQEP